jgi:autotransporter translocation and assembly factor TamB
LAVQVAAGENLSAKGSGVTAPISATPNALRLAGTPQRPSITGSLASHGGRTSLPTSTLDIDHFSLDYSIEPRALDAGDPVELVLGGNISGLAQTTLNRTGDTPIRLEVNISGQLPDQVRVTTTATPPLTDTQIYALLGGVPSDYVPGVGKRDTNGTQLVSQEFLASLANAFRLRVFQPLQDELMRALGLSELGVTFAFNEPVTVKVGKYLVRNLEISYSRPVSSEFDQYDLDLSYQLPAGLKITYHSDELEDHRLQIGYSWSY